jgi:hypothetical protein
MRTIGTTAAELLKRIQHFVPVPVSTVVEVYWRMAELNVITVFVATLLVISTKGATVLLVLVWIIDAPNIFSPAEPRNTTTDAIEGIAGLLVIWVLMRLIRMEEISTARTSDM